MDPKPKDPSSGGGDLDEFTIARKRSRRVSFAETTAVHVFARDEDFETPPDSKPTFGDGSKPGNEELGFHADSHDSKGLEDDDDAEDDDGEQEKFIRDMDSSSPASATGSMTSNDDDNFFGPVSTSFIVSGRLSEAGMSDDNNHDITLDSTAFSLHFQNIVPPDDRSVNSAGSLRTPTGDSLPTDSHGFVFSKGFKKQAPRSKFSDEKVSASAGDSSNMSLVVENPDSYDRYGKMSPTLEALLAEANKSMPSNSPISGNGTRTSQHENQVPTAKEPNQDEIHGCSTSATGMADNACFDSNIAEGRSVGIGSGQNGNGMPSPIKAADQSIDALVNEKDQVSFSPKFNGYSKDVPMPIQYNVVAKGVQNSDMLSPPYRESHNSLTLQSDQTHQGFFLDQGTGHKYSLGVNLQSTPIHPGLVNVNSQQELLFDHGMRTPQDLVQPFLSPLLGSVSSLRGKRQQLFLDPSALSQNRLMNTPDKELPLSSLKMKLIQHGERISAIKIPKSMTFKSPVVVDSRSAMSEKDSITHEVEDTLGKNNKGHTAMGVSAGHEKDGQIKVSLEDSGHNMSMLLNHSSSPTTNNSSVLTNLGENGVGGTFKLTTGISSVELSQSKTGQKNNQLILDNLTEHTSTPEVCGLKTLGEPTKTVDALHDTVPSPIGMVGDKLSASLEGCFSPKVTEPTCLSSSLERNGLRSTKSFTALDSDEVSELQGPTEFKNGSPVNKLHERIGESKNFHLGKQDGDTMIEKDLTTMKERLPIDETVSSNCHPLEDVNKLHATVNISAEVKCLPEGGTGNPNQEQIDNHVPNPVSLNNMLLSELAQDPFLSGNNLTCPELQSAQKSHSIQTEASRKKRGIAQIFPAVEGYLTEASRIHKSPKVLPDLDNGKCGIFPGRDTECSNEAVGNKGQAQEHWTDILSKVVDATKQPLSSSICKLDSVELDILEDILGELQTARKYARLFTSLRNHRSSDEYDHKRVAEARSFLGKLVYEKAKVQLKRMKLDKLSDKAQLCKSKIQEFVNLKSFYPQFFPHNARHTEHGESQQHDSNNSYTTDEGEYNTLASMRQELEMLDQKLKHMMKAFETSCRIKGNMSCNGIIKAVNDHMDMKTRCRLIQQDLQIWKLSDVITKNDQCNIVLNYCNVLFQRFTLHSRSVSGIIANAFLDNANIEKNFPNMNACRAFDFVFRAKGDRKVADSKQLSQETMETNLLLGSLLDVLEEVLISRTQSWNLISSTFHSQSCQLDLRLSFISFRSGRRITLSLDLSILNCAGYPSKPCDLQIRIIEADSTLPPSVSDKIMGAVESLDSGRYMIVRLCQSISKIVRDSDGL